MFNLDERYSYNTDRIGRGAFSDVYMGYDHNNCITVAIKKIDAVKYERTIIYFEREIAIMKTLDHINIIKLYNNFYKEGNLYIILEYCPNGSLSSISKPISEELAQNYFLQMLSAIRYIRSKGITHRDIKPDNILLDANGQLKLSDFGFALYSYNNLMHTTCGSPLYMAPEVIRGETYNDKADLWSLGMIIYELVVGTHPFKNCKNLFDLHQKISEHQFTFIDSNLSIEIKDLLTNILKKEPHMRISWAEVTIHKWANNQIKIQQRWDRSDASVSESLINSRSSIGPMYENTDALGSFVLENDSFTSLGSSIQTKINEARNTDSLNYDNTELRSSSGKVLSSTELGIRFSRSEPINLHSYIIDTYNPFPNSPPLHISNSGKYPISSARSSSSFNDIVSTSYDLLTGSIKKLQSI